MDQKQELYLKQKLKSKTKKMKKVLKTLTATAVAMALLIHNANAQIAMRGSSSTDALASSVSTSDNVTIEQKDKNILSSIPSRAVKDFHKSFKGIKNEEWSKLTDGYIAKFTEGSIVTRVGYNSKGGWVHTIRYYSEKQLPSDIRDRVKSIYYDYTIFNVAEVYFTDEPVYLVYIQDNTHLKTIRIYDGQMEEVQNFIRG